MFPDCSDVSLPLRIRHFLANVFGPGGQQSHRRIAFPDPKQASASSRNVADGIGLFLSRHLLGGVVESACTERSSSLTPSCWLCRVRSLVWSWSTWAAGSRFSAATRRVREAGQRTHRVHRLRMRKKTFAGVPARQIGRDGFDQRSRCRVAIGDAALKFSWGIPLFTSIYFPTRVRCRASCPVARRRHMQPLSNENGQSQSSHRRDSYYFRRRTG